MKQLSLAIILIVLFVAQVSVVLARVELKSLHNLAGEETIDYEDFVQEFAKVFKGYNIGGERNYYILAFIGDKKKSTVEICYRPCDGLAPMDNPGSVFRTICEIKIPLRNKEEVYREAKSAALTSFFTLITLDLMAPSGPKGLNINPWKNKKKISRFDN